MTVRVNHSTGQTTRYHTKPQVSRFLQTDADHSWGVAAIIITLHPNPSRKLICQAIFHDSGEKWAGDLPFDFKRAFPNLAADHGRAETLLCMKHGVPQIALDDEEARWLKFADQLECHLYVAIHAPHVLLEPDWKVQGENIRLMALALGIEGDIFA